MFVPRDEAPGGAAPAEASAEKPGRPSLRGRPAASSNRRRRRNAAVVADSSVPASELAQRRDVLAKEYAELQWDLGGLVYEMAARDHFRLDVVVRRAAKLQAVDAELAEAERLLRLEEAGAAGACPACGALYARGAAFCWQCGKDLMPRATVSAQPVPAPGQPSATPTEALGAKAAAIDAGSGVPAPAPASPPPPPPPAAAPTTPEQHAPVPSPPAAPVSGGR
jgi:hypothetical protein